MERIIKTKYNVEDVIYFLCYSSYTRGLFTIICDKISEIYVVISENESKITYHTLSDHHVYETDAYPNINEAEQIAIAQRAVEKLAGRTETKYDIPTIPPLYKGGMVSTTGKMITAEELETQRKLYGKLAKT